MSSRLAGEVVHPRHPDYQRARRVWNHMIDRRPALIVRCASDADVAAAIKFARECTLRLTVKGGGHSVAGHSMVDNGVIIDLGRMRQVRVDPGAGRVRVGGGSLLADMDRATQAFGLATPAGVMSQTGVAGLALGGGMGWLSRKHGLTCDHLIAARVVLADGSVRTASASENPDLYWGLRGAGTNFGVVTEFEFAAQTVGTTLPVGVALYHIEDAADAIRHHGQTMLHTSDDLKVMIYLRRAAAEPGVPHDLLNAPVCMFVSVWTGDPADAAGVYEQLWAGAPRVFENIQTLPYVALQSLNDSALGPGACNYTKGGYAGEMTDGCIEALIEAANCLPNGLSAIEFGYQHGAQDRLGEDDTAFTDRHADYLVNVLGRWRPGDEARPHIDWVRDTFAGITPWQTGGLYSNFMAVDDDHRVREAYRNGKYERLATIKAKYDPDNVFSSNPNILPARTNGPGV
ncbi:FAD-binding oxidoreductase [Mycobacterium sp. 852002-51057_SCH5723018]|uniref:FAD-binding oxidoreductase n=1 Tax=Mycobacterium sp. 852002-51057_SCH5723018 TaxID=1834094 RepID=UPI0018D45F37|nr:FAD-binding oxidoreductase [Mycobacterium sp. 852002-51057_SCH5723018]